LFPFSLIERAEQLYTRTIGNMSGDWEELRDDFCYSFSLTERIDSLPTDILDFEQLEESIGAAWARFLCLLRLYKMLQGANTGPLYRVSPRAFPCGPRRL